MRGKTYTLTETPQSPDEYYRLLNLLVEKCLEEIPDERELLDRIQRASGMSGFLSKLTLKDRFPSSLGRILTSSLSTYTADTASHLRNMSISDRFDATLRTTEKQYHLYMLEIELTNRINREDFSGAEYKIALLPHCLRDFHDQCGMVTGDIEALCSHCNDECFIHLGSVLMGRWGIKPYISVSMDHRNLFESLKRIHPEMGVLGVACVPELVEGMRLCRKLGIPALGVPLDANRCQRWMGQDLAGSFNLGVLAGLLGSPEPPL